MVPLETRVLLFRSLVLSHLSFSSLFFQNTTIFQINRINRKKNWGIKVCYLRSILPAELFLTQDSLTRVFDVAFFHTNEVGRQFSHNREPMKLNERTN